MNSIDEPTRDYVSIAKDAFKDCNKTIIDYSGMDIAIYNIDGEFHAIANFCPHQSGPLCEGIESGTLDATYDRKKLEVSYEWTKEGEIAICPWHGWEVEITSGKCLSRGGLKIPTFEVEELDEVLRVYV